MPRPVRREGILDGIRTAWHPVRVNERIGPHPLSALHTVLVDHMGVKTLAELAAKPKDDVLRLLDNAPVPPSEAVLGALVISAVHELRDATERLDTGTSQLLSLTRWLVALAALTLAAAIVTLAVTLVK
jgi:hypothetical protein